MNNMQNMNAVNIRIGSLGYFTEECLNQLLSSSEVTTSYLGGRLVQVGKESFLINKLAKEILKQNNSPATCEALRQLYVLSNKDVGTTSTFTQVAAAFRDSLTCNAMVMEKMKAATAQRLQAINQKTQASLGNDVEMVTKPIVTPNPAASRSILSTKSSTYAAVTQKEESEAEIEKEKERARQEELWLLTRDKKQTEKKLETLKEALSKQEAAILQLEVTSLEATFSQKNVGSLEESRAILRTAAQHALALEKKTSILKEIQDEEAFLKQVNKKVIPLQTEEDYAKIFDEVVKLENLPKTAPVTPTDSGRSTPTRR